MANLNTSVFKTQLMKSCANIKNPHQKLARIDKLTKEYHAQQVKQYAAFRSKMYELLDAFQGSDEATIIDKMIDGLTSKLDEIEVAYDQETNQTAA